MKISPSKLSVLLLLILAWTLKSCGFNQGSASSQDPWDQLDQILSKVIPPEFPNRDFSIMDYGAVADGTTKNTDAFRKAIEACNAVGGGRVVVPEGEYLTGPIYLKSNVNLHVQKGAKILFSTDPDDYLPVVFTRWEGIELMNYSPLIYAYEEKNIAITGEGILDGQAERTKWWPWKGMQGHGWIEGTPNQRDENNRPRLDKLASQNVPVNERIFGDGHYLRPPFIQPYKCQNVLIQGVTLLNSPFWFVHPVLCENVTVDGLTISGLGPNNDGCNPESSRYVLIKNCSFNTGDDCIAIKSGRDEDGRRINVPSENIVIQNCNMANGHGGVVIGSEVSGSVRNVFAEDCKMDSPRLRRGLRIKTSSKRGGIIENVYLRNIEIGQVSEHAIHINMFYNEPGDYLPTVRNIEIKNMTVQNGGKAGIFLKGYEESPVENLRLINVTMRNVEKDMDITNAKDLHFLNVEIGSRSLVLQNP